MGGVTGKMHIILLIQYGVALHFGGWVLLLSTESCELKYPTLLLASYILNILESMRLEVLISIMPQFQISLFKL